MATSTETTSAIENPTAAEAPTATETPTGRMSCILFFQNERTTTASETPTAIRNAYRYRNTHR